MRRTLAAFVAIVLVALPGRAIAQEAHTLKERLSDKASDPQRVDNCHVPSERRGPVPRPDCPGEPRPAMPAAEAGTAAAPKTR